MFLSVYQTKDKVKKFSSNNYGSKGFLRWSSIIMKHFNSVVHCLDQTLYILESDFVSIFRKKESVSTLWSP